ncbi:MAG: cation:proton antiporter subunit C [Oceanococcaceae bacterium]
MSLVFSQVFYALVGLQLVTGLYLIIAQDNLIKKLLGLSVFQVAIFEFYLSLGKLFPGGVPIEDATPGWEGLSHPLPHVLILTAIVVGIATLAVGLALVVRVQEELGSIEEDEARGGQGG